MILDVNTDNLKEMNYPKGLKRIYFIISFVWFFFTSSYFLGINESLFTKIFIILIFSIGLPFAIFLIIEWIIEGFKK